MALIKCPQCGNQVSDKAAVCPHCGIEVQKVLEEIREVERQQKKKRKRRILISTVSVCLVAAIAFLSNLYYNDALNSIPAEYRKQTENYFVDCESAINNGYFDLGNGYLRKLSGRTLTNRQTNRFEKIKKAVAELGLKDVEDKLVESSDNSDIQHVDGALQNARKGLDALAACQLDDTQAERLRKAWAKYKELRLEEIEKRIGLLEGDKQVTFTIENTTQLVKELQKMDLSNEQKTRLEEANKKIAKIQKQKEEKQHKQLLKTIREEYIRLLDDNRTDDFGYSDEGYFLYDIDNNGIPELWIKTGTCEADYLIRVYTYDNGVKFLYGDDAGHSSFHKGDSYIIQSFGHMGHSIWDKLTYDGTTITSTQIYEEYSDDYKDPEEKYITLYPLTNKQPVLNAFRY